MIYVHKKNKEDLRLRRSEIYRYLGYGPHAPEENVLRRIESIYIEVMESLAPRACVGLFPVTVTEETVDFGTFSANSVQLSKNLSGCKSVVAFVATIGAETDRIIEKYNRISPASAVVAQAVGTAAVEQWCDDLVLEIAQSMQKEKKYLRPRFSPGYGDFSLTCQIDLLKLLDASRKIGVSLTDACQMVPIKSVSAVAGISETDEACSLSGCELCEKRKECLFARG